MTKLKKKYIVRCTSCNKRLFDAYSADIEIKCSHCKNKFKIKINRGFDLNE